MSLQSPLRIHIAPVGYEDERIYIPAIENRADKVILLVTSEEDEQVDQCLENIHEALEAEGIDVVEETCDIFDPDQSIQVISTVIRRHPDDDIKVNISTGSKITAISGMLACMMTGAEPYYAKAEDYGDEPVSKGVSDVVGLPAYPIDPPEQYFVQVLDFLSSKQEKEEDVKIQDLNEFVREENLEPVQGVDRSEESGIYDIVQADIIEPLSERDYIQIQPYGGSKFITLTNKGKRTLEFSRHILGD